MKQVKALKPFFFGAGTLTPADGPVEVDNERAAALVKQGMAEYAGELPPVDPMLTAHLEPEPEPLPPVLADPSQAPEEVVPGKKTAKAAPPKENDPEFHKRSHHAAH
jgi:hypothetical protein